MELWVVLAIIAAATYAFCIFVDNYVTDIFFKNRKAQAQKVFYGPLTLFIAILIGVFGEIQTIPVENMLWLLISGVISGASLIPYVIALKRDESTNISLIEQLSPVFYLPLGWLMLGENISAVQIVALFIILIAPMMIIFSARKKGQKTKLTTAGLMLLKIIPHAIACVLVVKYGYDCSFVTMLFFVLLGRGIGDTVMTLVFKSWRKDFKKTIKRNGKKVYAVMTIDNLMWTVADFSYYAALMFAPALAMASGITKTLQPLLVFVFGIILTLLWPRFGREKLDRKTVMVHLVATIIAVLGIILMQNC